MSHRDLSLDEQEHVRVCLRSLRAKFGNWRNVERSLPVAHSVLVDVMAGKCEVSVAIAQGRDKGRDLTRRVLTVAVHLDCDVIAGVLSDQVPSLDGGADSKIERQRDHARSGAHRFGGRPIAGAVVDDDDVDPRECPQLGDHGRNRCALVESRHDCEAAGPILACACQNLCSRKAPSPS